MVKRPGERPGASVPPVVETAPVRVPTPPRIPPWSATAELSLVKLPPLRMVEPAVWVYADDTERVPLRMFTVPELLKAIEVLLVNTWRRPVLVLVKVPSLLKALAPGAPDIDAL